MSFKPITASAPNLVALNARAPPVKSLELNDVPANVQASDCILPEEAEDSTATLVLGRRHTNPKTLKERWSLSGSFGRLFKTASSTSSNSTLDADIDWGGIFPNKWDGGLPIYVSRGTIRRLESLHQIYAKLTDPSRGIPLHITKVAFKSSVNGFTGAELLDWFGPFNDDIHKEDYMSICRWLVNAGFIISLEQPGKFSASSSSSYVFQMPALLPRPDWAPSDLEYARFLLRKSKFALHKYSLESYEISRLEKLRQRHIIRWPTIEKQVDKDLLFIGGLRKETFKVYRLQEAVFWNIYCPAEGEPGEFMNADSIKVKKKRMSEEDYEASMKDQESLLKWKLSRLEQLKGQEENLPSRVSQSTSKLIEFCTLGIHVDPLVNAPASYNPWTTTDEAAWDGKRDPSVDQITYWKSSFQNLFKDSLGLHYFRQFLLKEFSDENLAFVLDTRALIYCSTKDDFYRSSKMIYDTYVAIGSPREINIASNIRNKLNEEFRDTKDVKEWSNFDCFDDAVNHVMQLMGTDSYNRFCKTL